MKFLDRRNFIKSSVLGASGLVIAKKSTPIRREFSERKVITRTLGKTGIELPVISMGIMNTNAPGMVNLAYEKGIKHFDTAHMYQEGLQEAMLGEFFKDKPRDSYFIATKVVPPGMKDYMTGKIEEDFTVDAYLEMFETSLDRLKMDYVDIFYQHVVGNRESVLHDGLLGAMQKIKEEGKARFIGVSTHYNQAEVIRAANESEIYDVALVGYNFMLDNHEEISEAMAEGAANGMGFIGMKALAGNYLAEEKGNPVNPVAALKWVLKDPNICTIIPGYTSYDQIETDIEVMYDINLTPEEEAELEEGRKLTGLFCQGCGTCSGTCPNKLPVPDLMRAYMYAYGYFNMEKARYVLDSRGISVNPCENCNTCTVECAKQFPVKERISKIARLKSVHKDFIV